MTSNERATAFYNKHLAGRLVLGTDAGKVIANLEEAFREASREATREAVDAAFRLLQAGKNYDNTQATP